jgi:co-chaperonin GroES (HSP10)
MKLESQDINKSENWIPLSDNVIVRPIKVTMKDKYVRPQNEEDKAELGEVIRVPDHFINHTPKVGDTVLFNKYSSTAMDMSKDLIVRLEDIVAVLKK